MCEYYGIELELMTNHTRHHQIIAKGIAKPQVAAEFAEHAVDEERHMMMLATNAGGNIKR